MLLNSRSMPKQRIFAINNASSSRAAIELSFPIERLKIHVIIKSGQIVSTVTNKLGTHTEAMNMDSRKRMGKDKDGVIFPVAPNLSEKVEITKQQLRQWQISMI